MLKVWVWNTFFSRKGPNGLLDSPNRPGRPEERLYGISLGVHVLRLPDHGSGELPPLHERLLRNTCGTARLRQVESARVRRSGLSLDSSGNIRRKSIRSGIAEGHKPLRRLDFAAPSRIDNFLLAHNGSNPGNVLETL